MVIEEAREIRFSIAMPFNGFDLKMLFALTPFKPQTTAENNDFDALELGSKFRGAVA